MIKRKKNSRQRGSKTHGWGAMKKHRGAGNKGGTGNAGSGKRSDTKKPQNWKDPKYFGKHGFKFHGKTEEIISINIRDLHKKYPTQSTIDLVKEGYNKLLGAGVVKRKLEINVSYASAHAITKIQKAGGTITGLVLNKVSGKKTSETMEKAQPIKEGSHLKPE